MAAEERLAVPAPRALRRQALQVLPAELVVVVARRVGRHEAMAAVHQEAAERPLPADAAVVAAAFN